jgi:dipeptidyl aminopeptidase/acylaminoacyl peptidase
VADAAAEPTEGAGRSRRSLRRWAATAVAVLLLGGAAWTALAPPSQALPPGLTGVVVYVSDRAGTAALYARHLPDGPERRLTTLSEPVADPALSPDGRHVAFVMGGRLGLVSVGSKSLRFLTVGVDWKDAAPAWRPDGRALVVAARRPGALTSGIHLLTPAPDDGETGRRILVDTPVDETDPSFLPSGGVVFVREDNLFRLDEGQARPRRMTGGFRKFRKPRLLPSGRLLCLWSEGKTYGIDRMDADGKNRETLVAGTTYYRTLAPSPDGRFLAATFAFDLAFHPSAMLRFRHPEEVRILDARGAPLATLASSWRHANHSPSWGP